MVTVAVRSADPLSISAEDLLHQLGPEKNAAYTYMESLGTGSLYAFLKAGSDFFLAYVEGHAVGCVGYRKFPFEETDVIAQMRMLMINPEYRWRQVAAALLKEAETTAARRGYVMMRVELDLNHPEAQFFFEEHGYNRVPKYGPFVDDPMILCLERLIV
ncbi:GNAT family N-acetyltransferase [Deinococcus cellulosilyticus]|uniref:N-acetyltransferase domain-containing protein n=1 Tax=Deinococcus cellulosilyticus (strain DSM 18568 / NBRC 106333 / KACC 11606 / 5516J-15) TaxID=1223518 RepID=A0A511N5I6_DEIC1|nr:GNAT family N-acetyltransferase [Deinococcus cellulosilyticus]GEM48129.1 hypothetical protein DC3_37640 [Deinococcus cellulosilyticus NBRC 106333 = KACC 11606]